jgi:hypothetical protein
MKRLRRSRRHVVAAIVIVATLAAVTSCGAATGSGDSRRALTADEAEMLAGALYQNFERSGGDFDLAAQIAPGATINLSGEVDWAGHLGHATVAGRGTETGVGEVYWSDSTVLERRDDLNAVLAASDRPGIVFVARPIDRTRPLDQLLAAVTGLASEQRDNALLIRQDAANVFVRADTLRGTAVVVLAFGATTTYWLDVGDGSMLRLEGDNGAGTRPLVLDIAEHGERSIEQPEPTSIIDVALIQPIYDGFVDSG